MNKSIIFILIFTLFLSATAYSLDKPIVESLSHPNSEEWTNMSQATFRWQDIEGATGYSYIIDQFENTEPDSEIDTTISQISKSVSSGIFYFHVKAIGNGEISQTAHYKFKVDSENPAIPTNVKVESKEEHLLVSWEQEPDLLSGISHYELYRSSSLDFDIRDIGVKKITQTNNGEKITTPYFEDYDITENRVYFYKLRVFDNAGNARLTFAAKGTKTLGECSSYPNLDLSIEKKILKMEVTTTLTTYDYKIELEQDGEKQTALFISKLLSTATENFDISKYKDGVVKVFISSLDKDKDECLDETSFVIDTKGPTIEVLYPEKNSSLVEKTPFYITAIDEFSEIKSIKYYLRKGEEDKYIATFSRNDENYFSNLFPDMLEEGQNLILIIAEDDLGNKTEKTISFVSNPLNQMEKEIKKNITDSELILNEIKDNIEKYLHYSSEFEKLISETSSFDYLNQKLKERTLTEEDLQTSITLKEKLQTLKDSFKKTTTKQIKIEVIREIKEALKEQGVKEEYLEKSLLTNEKITKIIEFTKYEAGLISQETATIYYEIPFSPAEGENFLLIEFLPKGINIQNLTASLSFSIIDSDPIIAFDISKEKIIDGKIIFSYTVLADNFTKANPAGVFGGVPLIIQKPETIPEKDALYQSNDLIIYIVLLGVIFILAFFGLKFVKFPTKKQTQKSKKAKFSTPKKK